MRTVLMLMLMLVVRFANGAEPLPIFDAHVHCSQDAWALLPPKDAIAILKKAGVKRALVSSSNDDGNQKLYAEAPDIILPPDVAERIAYRNGESIFGNLLKP